MPTGLTGALTLGQYAQQSNDPLVASVVSSLLQADNPLNDVQFTVKPSLKINGARLKAFSGSVSWRALNGSTTVTSNTATPFQEQAYTVSNAIDVDRMLVLDENQISDPVALQVSFQMQNIGYDIADKFFNNNHVSGDANAPIGIRERLDSASTWGTNTNCKINSNGVDMTSANMTAATANSFIEYVQQALHECGAPEGDGCVIYVNRNLKRKFERAVRLLGSGGGFDMTKDAFDRPVYTYRNAVVRTIGVKADQSTEIITNTETNAGANGSSNYTSLYVVRHGVGQFRGWMNSPLQAFDIGLRSDEPTHYRVLIEGGFGYLQEHTRSLARVYGVKVS